MFRHVVQKYKKIKDIDGDSFSNLSLRQIASYFTINSSGYIAVSFLQEALAFLLLPLYMAKLSRSEYGTLELVIVCSSIIAVIMALELYNIVNRRYFEWEEAGVLGESIFTVWFFCLVFSISIGLILHFFGQGLLSKLFNNLKSFQLDYAILLAFLSSQQLIPRFLMRIKGDLTLYSITNICGFSVGVLANLYLIIVAGKGLQGALIAQVLTATILAIGYSAYAIKYMKPSIRQEYIIDSLKFSLPMVPGALGNILSVSLDRIILGKVMSMDALGTYSYARKIGQIMQVFAQIVKTAWLPFYMRLVAQRKADFRTIIPKFANAYCLIMVFTALTLATFSREILMLIGGYKYMDISIIISMFILGGYLYSMYFVFSNGVIMSNKTYVYSLTVFASFIASIAGNLILIPLAGLYGGAVSYIISYLIMLIITIYVTQKYFYLPYHFHTMIKIMLSAIILYFIAISIELSIVNYSKVFFIKVVLIIGFGLSWAKSLSNTMVSDSKSNPY